MQDMEVLLILFGPDWLTGWDFDRSFMLDKITNIITHHTHTHTNTETG